MHDDLRDEDDDKPDHFFIMEFNRRLELLGCDVRVAALAEDRLRMAIVDLHGHPIGVIGRGIEPAVFCDFMVLIHEAFSEGVEFGRANPGGEAPPSITVQ